MEQLKLKLEVNKENKKDFKNKKETYNFIIRNKTQSHFISDIILNKELSEYIDHNKLLKFIW